MLTFRVRSTVSHRSPHLTTTTKIFHRLRPHRRRLTSISWHLMTLITWITVRRCRICDSPFNKCEENRKSQMMKNHNKPKEIKMALKLSLRPRTKSLKQKLKNPIPRLSRVHQSRKTAPPSTPNLWVVRVKTPQVTAIHKISGRRHRNNSQLTVWSKRS